MTPTFHYHVVESSCVAVSGPKDCCVEDGHVPTVLAIRMVQDLDLNEINECHLV